MAKKVIKTCCTLCVWGCGLNAYVEDGKLVKVEGMTEHPLSQGLLCPRGEHIVDFVYSPDRLKYPMKKENGDWKRISWDEALDTIASRLELVKDKYGAKALAIYCGSIGAENIAIAAYAQRFKGAYGTPNFFGVESICYRCRILGRFLTFGTYPLEDEMEELVKARCVILWGRNPDESNTPLASRIYKALDNGLSLIIVNPKRIPVAKRGMHLQIRPGTDLALALGMMNVVIAEGLYDKEFVEKYTVGFDKLAEHVKQYPPAKVAEITWLPAEDIKRAARMFAGAESASIIEGTCSLDQQINGLQNNRALSILQAITGNYDVRGGWRTTPFLHLTDLRLAEPDIEPIGADLHPLFRRFWNKTSPYGQAIAFPEAVLGEKPYPVKALIVTAGNPALTLPDSQKVKQAFGKLDFIVVMDLFMTETAQLADIVLPACSFVEWNGPGPTYDIVSGLSYFMLRKKLIEPLGECWPDWKFWSELGRRMGYADLFPWHTDEEAVEHLLKASGLTLEQVTSQNPEGRYYADKCYDINATGQMRTPSGKIEIYSETLAQAGYDPIPVYIEPTESRVSTPELAREYPLTLSTGARVLQYTHTQMRNIPQLRRLNPEPVAEVHPDTAGRYGIADGDMIAVSTKRGQIKMRARTTGDLAPDMVSIPHGWAQANANILTCLEHRDPITGTPELKALLCKIEKV